jgi:hypothetical protein
MSRSKKARWKPGTFAAVVFHSPAQQQVSPVVAHLWKQPVVDLLLKSEEPFTTNDVNVVCARWIGWCCSQPEVDTFELGVYNVPSPAGRPDSEDPEAWYTGAMAALSELDPPPVLVNLDIYEITCGGQVLVGADAVGSLMEVIRGTSRDEDYKEYEDRVNRAEYPYAEVLAILRERCEKPESEPSSADARPMASNAPDSPRSKDKKGKARKRPPRP